MEIKLTVSNPVHHVGALLRSTPITAARHGLLGVLHDLLTCTGSPWAGELHNGSAELRDLLGVPDVYGVPDALREMAGRPPKRVVAALRRPELVAALCQSLDDLSLGELYHYAEAWGPQTPDSTVPLAPERRAERSELMGALRRRAGEILAAWTAAKIQWRIEPVGVDGRTMFAAARAWQVPMVNGELVAPPESMAPRYANRLGKCAAAVAFSRVAGALRSPAPDAAVWEPVALLLAVGEAVSRMSWREADQRAALHGLVGMRVPAAGSPVPEELMGLESWWPVFSAWGASARREACSIPTAWRLSDAEGDVVVWALCSVAVRLALAASFPSAAQNRTPGWQPPSWEEHVAGSLPDWELGARSLWLLMQSTRDVSKRTRFPAGLLPGAGRESWPWFVPELSESTDMVGDVPGPEEAS